MRPSNLLALGVVAALAPGCFPEKVPPLEEQHTEYNAGVVNNVLDQAIRDAVLRQHSLFGYHFLMNSARLNKLGEHDLALLAACFKDRPGPLYVRQGDTDPELYEARVNEVKRLLIEAGVDKERIAVKEGLPGGDGIPMEGVLTISAPSAPSKSSK